MAQAQAPAPNATGQSLSTAELAKLKQNPVSGLRQVILDAYVSPDVPDADGSMGSYSLQLVWPFSLGKQWKLISYTILPLIDLPETDDQGSTTGLGDTLINFLVSPKKPGTVIWGLGPAVMLPTRTEPELGSDQLGLGPSAVVFYESKAWSAGLVLQNVWSLGGSGIDKVNELGAQYIFNYNLPDSWYLYSNATITADWEVEDGERWTVPLGGGIGKVFKIGKQSANLAGQVFSNVVKPTDGPSWAWNVQFALMFP